MRTILTTLLLTFATSGALAQDAYPSRPVTAIVGYLPGGAADIVMRKLASIMAPKFPAGLIVENKPGAGGSIAVSMLKTAKPDGYQFAFVPNSNLALSPQVNKLSYKSPDELEMVINVISFAPVLLVTGNSPYKSLQDFVQAAKQNPETISVGFPGETTLSHLNLLELERVTGASFIKVAMKGWGEGSPQLLGGHISAAVAQPVEAVPFLKSGKMRALGSFSDLRQPGLPDLPTMKEQGASVGFPARYLVIVPKATPKAAVKYIHDAAKAAMETPEFKDFTAMAALNVDYQDGDTAREAALTDFKTYTSILKQNNLIK